MRGTPKRAVVNKSRAAKGFKHDIGRTHKHNLRLSPRRGGWRL